MTYEKSWFNSITNKMRPISEMVTKDITVSLQYLRRSHLTYMMTTSDDVHRKAVYEWQVSFNTNHIKFFEEELTSRGISMRDKQDEEKQELFKSLNVPMDCDECPYIISTRDAFNKGESMTEYSCGGSHNYCPAIN